MTKVTFHEDANLEVNEAVQYYEKRAFGLGNAFITEIEEAVWQISTNPEAFQLIGEEVRRKLIKRFPFSRGFICPLCRRATTGIKRSSRFL